MNQSGDQLSGFCLGEELSGLNHEKTYNMQFTEKKNHPFAVETEKVTKRKRILVQTNALITNKNTLRKGCLAEYKPLKSFQSKEVQN